MVYADQIYRDDPKTEPVSARLKWFDAEKGFGFVIPENSQGDAFLHAAVLRSAGITSLGDGATILCRVQQRAKGAQVSEVLTVLDAGGPSKSLAPSKYTDVTGVVKWYKAERGYGFVAADDQGKDVLLTQRCLKQYGFDFIQPRTPLAMKVKTTEKGREAVEFQIVD